MIFEGTISTKSILEANKRDINELILQEGKYSKDIGYIKAIASKRNIAIRIVSKEQYEQIVSGKTSGGVALDASSRCEETLSLDDLGNLVVCLEGIEDPFNLGYCLRTLYSFGCHSVLLRKRLWNESEIQILKSSAGASEKMNLFLSDDLVSDIKSLKENGYTVVCAHRKDAKDCRKLGWPKKTVLIIGGEMRGISSGLMALKDISVFVPYANDFRNALNASSATAVLAYSYFEAHGEDYD